jgi:adenine-specific DNA-methyltransferase
MRKKNPIVKIKHGDSQKLLDQFEPESFDLIITSPPYNVGKKYESRKSIEDYLAEQEVIIEKLIRLLSPNGSICWQVGNSLDRNKKEIYPLDIFYYNIFKEHNLFLKNRIVWHFGHGLHARKKFSGRYETILWFTKSANNFIFNLDSVRIRQKYPSKKHFKGPNKGKLSGNPKGKNPSDVWEIMLNDWEGDIWNIPNVKANHKEKTIHECQFPIELIERCILALSNKDSWVLDPFAGVGSTMIAAYKNNRNSVGIELDKEYIVEAKKRLKLLKYDKLPMRDISQPIYDHTKSKLSQIPLEFRK